MIGNLKIYFGADRAGQLQPLAARGGRARAAARSALLWGVRIVLIVAVAVAHRTPPTTLTLINRRARPEAYRSKRDYVAADFASRTMRWTGIIVAALRDLPPARPDVGPGEPGLRRGRPVPQRHRVASSASRSRSSTWSRTWRSACTSTTAPGACSRAWAGCGRGGAQFAIVFAGLIVLGNVSFPLAVMFGVVN